MITYYKIEDYMSSCSGNEARVAAINTILDNMQTAMIAGALTSNKQEYRLDDGQTKIEVVYRDFNALSASYKQLLEVKEMILQTMNNNKNGRVVRRIDSKNFPGYRYGNF